jgi:sugar transferase (PEP-CTERM/EpsH1 system associated)
MVPYLRSPGLRGVAAVVDLVDVDSQKWLDYAAAGRGPRSWLHRLEGRRLRQLERALPEWARAITLVSPAEAELYRAACGTGPVHAVVNGVDQDYFQPRPIPPSAESGCVFVGALDYRPNVDAAEWFCTEVWPEVHRRRPADRFVLVGRRPTPAIGRLAERPGVVLVGQVADVRPHLAAATVVVAPLRIARGIQNKVLEAMAMAKPVLASPQALEGLEALPGQDLMVAESPREWVASLDFLMGDAPARQALGAAALAFVRAHHHWDRCLDPFARLLRLPSSPCGSGQPALQSC